MKSQITVMKNNTEVLGNPLAGGNKICLPSQLPKSLEDYVSNEFCLSCAYFQQTKGHFGMCLEANTLKVYDGSKKGSACLCYRTKSDLIGLERQELISIKPVSKIRNEYNQKVQINLQKKRIESEKPIKIYSDKKFANKLPFAQTSDINVKHGYWKHRVPSKIIDYAIELMDGSISANGISNMIAIKFNYIVSHKSVIAWAKKFKPNLVFPKGRKHDEQWNENIRLGQKVTNEIQNYTGVKQ